MSEKDRLHEVVQPLLRRVRAGDRDALNRLVDASRQCICRWVCSRTRDADEVDEVTQLVMIRLGQTAATYRGESRFTTWLYRLTTNVITDFYRSHSRRTTRVQNAPDGLAAVQSEVGGSGDERLDRIHDAEIVALIHFFFAKLPDRQREVFDLIDLQGFTPVEVSKMTGMNGSTVRANLFKARRAIRRQIVMRVPALTEELTNDV